MVGLRNTDRSSPPVLGPEAGDKFGHRWLAWAARVRENPSALAVTLALEENPMMRRVTLLTLPLVFLTSPVWAGDEPKNTDEAIAKYVEAIGGRARMDAVKTRRASGKMVMEGGMELPVAIELKRPNKFRSDSTFQGMTMTQAYDGAVGWMIMPFAGKTDPEKMSPEQIKLVESQSDMDGPLVDYQKKGTRSSTWARTISRVRRPTN